ncbi:MAG TPA: hypothetical protein VHT91_23715 [Kofleriaceae bacterium]|jgi:hypothetical protein|nr:hypothetical protein [Kofleriaceae bacterium]
MGGDMPPGGPGSDDPMGHPMDDPRDNPFLADINNSWTGPAAQAFSSFNFAASPSGKISSAVVRGNAFGPGGSSFQLDGLFYDHVVHVIAMQDGNVVALDGAFVNFETMDLTVEQSQARVVLICSTVGGRCM